MSDNIYAFTVILEHEVDGEGAEYFINAIKLMRGVADVKPHEVTPDVLFAEERARREWRDKVRVLLWPDK